MVLRFCGGLRAWQPAGWAKAGLCRFAAGLGVLAGIWRHGVRVWQAVQERFRQPFSALSACWRKAGRSQPGRDSQADAGLAPVPYIV